MTNNVGKKKKIFLNFLLSFIFFFLFPQNTYDIPLWLSFCLIREIFSIYRWLNIYRQEKVRLFSFSQSIPPPPFPVTGPPKIAVLRHRRLPAGGSCLSSRAVTTRREPGPPSCMNQKNGRRQRVRRPPHLHNSGRRAFPECSKAFRIFFEVLQGKQRLPTSP